MRTGIGPLCRQHSCSLSDPVSVRSRASWVLGLEAISVNQTRLEGLLRFAESGMILQYEHDLAGGNVNCMIIRRVADPFI